MGRDHELAVFDTLRSRARGGRRVLVVVSGEAGIGKTWLCERAAGAAERDGFDVVWGRCWPHGGAPPLWPWPTVLPQLTGPASAVLLAEDGGHGTVDPERFARFTAIAELVRNGRADRPTMVVVDDVHNADEGALLLTRFLVRALDRLPLFLVLVRRPDTADTVPLLVELERDATTVPLCRFDLHDTVALLAAHRRRLARPAVRDLLRVTGGIPLYLAHAIGEGADGLSVHSAIAQAVARLPADARHALSVAAVLGVDASIGEMAELMGRSPRAVLAALDVAVTAGLADPTPDGCAVHDVVRDVVLAALDPGGLLDTHARAAALLRGRAQPERVARHALAAARRSDRDAAAAIEAGRAAAASLRRGFAYEGAAEMLGRVVVLAEHRSDLHERADLRVQHAEAVLACGRLAQARALFEAAADAAERIGDAVLTARAVLGLGGTWVHEHRNPAVRRRVLARQQAACTALPESEATLRARLAVRLTAEAVYEGEPLDAVLGALAEVRRLGDERALAEALSLTHHAMLAPEHATARLPLAAEQITAASAAGDGVLALFGLLWRTVDLYLIGDAGAERSLAELRQRTDALGIATVSYVVACIDVMRLIRAGRLAEAEAAAAPCLERGLAVGDADATGYFGAQLLTIRWLQGRDADLVDLVSEAADSPSLAAYEYGFRACRATVLARAGRLDEARVALDDLLVNGVAALPRSSTWLVTMAAVIETARLLGDRTVAAETAQLLAPFADLVAMTSLAVSCLGSVARPLGLAASTTGDVDAAVTRLEAAVEANERIVHRPATALCRAELAEALLARDAEGDTDRAAALLTRAAADADAVEMPLRAAAWRARMDKVAPQPALLRRTARDGWTVLAGGNRIQLPELVGLRYLSRLLERPGEYVSAVDLCAAGVTDGRRQTVLDDAAARAYRQRVRLLDAALDEADATGDAERARRLVEERDAVAGELRRALGLGGRARTFAASPERARTAVRKAVKRALDAIDEADPRLGAELRAHVSTGFECCYGRPGSQARRWSVERG